MSLYEYIYAEKCKSEIHISLSVWDLADEYNRHAAVTILSVLSNCNQERKVVIHLLYDEHFSNRDQKATSINKERYYQLIQNYNAEIIFHHIDADPCFYDCPSMNIFTIGAMYRLYLPELLPNIDKTIYLDCDIVVNTDISELYDLDINNCSLAAVCSGDIDTSWKRYYNKLGVNPKLNLNSGVLIFNLLKIRQNMDIVSLAIDFMKKHPNSPYPDQDFLYFTFQNDYFMLDIKYNLLSNKLAPDDNTYSHSIVHYAYAIQKPWSSYNGLVDTYYWKYLAITPWGNNSSDLVKYARMSVDRYEFISSIPKWIYRYTIKEQFKMLWKLSGGLWLQLIKTYFYELNRRLKQ